MSESSDKAAPLQIGISVQYLKDMSFECPNAPHIFAAIDKAPEVDLGVNVQYRPLQDHTFDVLLMLRVEAKLDDQMAFLAEMSYGGVFSLPAMDEATRQFVLMVEAPRMLFPFARSILANAVRDGGFPQILVHPIDFAGLYQARMAQMDSAPATGTA